MKMLPLVPPDLHTWAGRNLEIAAEASPGEARAAFLRKLPEFEWVPPPALEESQDYWAHPEGATKFPSLLDQAIPDEELRLRVQVDEFADQFFQLAPAQRIEIHQRLADQCAWSVNLQARLLALARGHYVPRCPWDKAQGREKALLEHLCRLFTRSPADRARQRWEILQEIEQERDTSPAGRNGSTVAWAEVVRSVRRNYSEIASLERTLLQELVAGKTPDILRLDPLLAISASQAPAQAPVESSGGYHWLWIVAPILFMMLRFCSSNPQPVAPLQLPPQPVQAPRFNQEDLFKREDLLKKMREAWRDHPEKFRTTTIRLFGKDPVNPVLKAKSTLTGEIPAPGKHP